MDKSQLVSQVNTSKQFLLRLFKSLSILRTAPKIASSVFSFMIFLILLQNLGTNSFANLQVKYSLSAVLLWILDFGLMKTYIDYSSRGRILVARQIWTVRNFILFLLFMIICFLFLLNLISFDTSLLLGIALLDLSTDTYVESRIVNSSVKQSLIIQVMKKFILLLIFLLLSLTENHLNIPSVFLTYFIICGVIICIEQSRFGIFKFNLLTRKDFTHSAQYFKQSAGIQLLSLDVAILGLLGFPQAIILLSGMRRLSGSISIFGSTRSTQIFSSILKMNSKLPLKSEVLDVVIATCIPVIFCLIGLNFLMHHLLELDTTLPNVFLASVLLLLTPFGVLGSMLNSVLLALNLVNKVILINFFGSLTYLSTILLLNMIMEIQFALALSNVVYTFVSLSLYSRLYFGFRVRNGH